MNSSKTIKNIIIVLFIAVALLVVYSMVNSKGQEAGGTTGLTSSNLTSAFTNSPRVDDSEVQLANTEILKVLGSIQNIELRDDIFSNPVFRDLRDTRFSIPKPTNIGRPNPFLPIGFDDSSIQTVLQETAAEQPVAETPAAEEEAPEEQASFFPSGQQV
jgi:hypothetical protein